MPSLTELLSALDEDPAVSPPYANPEISSVASDSRQVKPGSLFAAIKGVSVDGEQFIPQAIAAGAAAVLCAEETKDADGITTIRVKNTRRALAQLAAAFYAAQPTHMVAVTGTDGKTSTADFFRQLMHGMGEKVASIGTLGVFDGKGSELCPGGNTTPGPIELHALLADLQGLGIEHACMEASSHGLHQYRLDGVKLEAAAFTNFARDHMDYHATEEEYFEAKARLFELLPEGATAVLNQDDERFAALERNCKQLGLRVLGFGRFGEALRLVEQEPLPHGQRITLDLLGRRREFELGLLGGFQVMNILAALGLVHGAGGDIQQAANLIPDLRGVPGRLEPVATLKNGAAILIDYAHTPMALASILKVLRPHTHGKLHVVFGCGGDRDPGKRPLMGKAAGELADRAIVTDDNPRSEDAALIRKAVMEGCRNGIEIPGRKEAIETAVRGLVSGDVLVIAGKGHEKYQIIGNKTYPFDDAVVAREAVEGLAA